MNQEIRRCHVVYHGDYEYVREAHAVAFLKRLCVALQKLAIICGNRSLLQDCVTILPMSLNDVSRAAWPRVLLSTKWIRMWTGSTAHPARYLFLRLFRTGWVTFRKTWLFNSHLSTTSSQSRFAKESYWTHLSSSWYGNNVSASPHVHSHTHSCRLVQLVRDTEGFQRPLERYRDLQLAPSLQVLHHAYISQ